ncbi:hypothetical protein MRB53_002321 [Persea americana]|uniref:Uncharacterized protein n=1 Tax=Persea americana TaxID=3435 RepID=A0ACC2MUH9_PERAE|nr:hypothetical protein MRB53_002321 [Persea americana]
MGPTTGTQAVTLNIPNPVINEHANDDLPDMTQIQPDPLPESSKQPMHHHVTPTKACTPSSPPPNGGILTILHRPFSIGQPSMPDTVEHLSPSSVSNGSLPTFPPQNHNLDLSLSSQPVASGCRAPCELGILRHPFSNNSSCSGETT